MRRSSRLLMTLVAVLMAGCSGSGPSSSRSATEPSTATAPTNAPTDSLTGLGATDAVWNAHHVPDGKFAAGSVYDPDPAVERPMNPDDFFDVMHDHARVVALSMAFPPSTTINEAKQAAFHLFPSDAEVAWFMVKDSCAQMAVKSAALTAAVPSMSNGVLISFDTLQSDGNGTYEQDGVNEAIVMTAGDISTPTAAPGC